MKKNRQILMALLYLLMALSCAQAQTQESGIRELKIGDTIPNLVVRNLMFHEKDSIELRELYRGGMLLVDFWATWCMPCINQLKQMDALKQQFPNFASIAVTYQAKEDVETFFGTETNRDVKTDRLTIATDDTLMRQLFPHRSIPHNVWVDSTGVVRAITNGRLVNADRINEFLAMQTFADATDVLKSDIMEFNSRDPFVLGDDSYEYRSIITPYIDGLNSGMTWNKQFYEKRRFFAYNSYLAALYWQAFGGFKSAFKRKLIDIITTDSLKFYVPIDQPPVYNEAHLLAGSKYGSFSEWQRENTYCYELVMPRYVPDSVFGQYVIDDLDRFFNCKSTVVEEIMPCLLLFGDPDKLNASLSLADDEAEPFVAIQYPKLVAQNITLDILADYLMGLYAYVEDPIMNETDYSQAFDLSIDFTEAIGEGNLGKVGISFDMVLKKLEDIGISASTEDRPYKKLVIVDLESQR